MAAPTMPGTTGSSNPEHQNQITQQLNSSDVPAGWTPEAWSAAMDASAGRFVAARQRKNKLTKIGVATGVVALAGGFLLGPTVVKNVQNIISPAATAAAPQPAPEAQLAPFGKSNQVGLTSNSQAVADAVVENHFALSTELFNRPTRNGYTADKIATDLQFLYDPDFLNEAGSPSIAGDTIGDEFTEQAKRFGGIINIQTDIGFWDHDLALEGDIVGNASFSTSPNGNPVFTARVRETADFIPAGAEAQNPQGVPTRQEAIDRVACLTFEQSDVVVAGVQGYYPASWRMTDASTTC
jgi:hypothetical protein